MFNAAPSATALFDNVCIGIQEASFPAEVGSAAFNLLIILAARAPGEPKPPRKRQREAVPWSAGVAKGRGKGAPSLFFLPFFSVFRFFYSSFSRFLALFSPSFHFLVFRGRFKWGHTK